MGFHSGFDTPDAIQAHLKFLADLRREFARERSRALAYALGDGFPSDSAPPPEPPPDQQWPRRGKQVG
jgi:hypothetical protein